MSKAEELLEKFKEQEDDADSIDMIIFLFNDNQQELVEGIITWKHSNVNFNPSKLGDTGNEWNDIWMCSEFDLKEMSQLMNQPVEEVKKRIKRLIDLKFIYPDGGVNKIALSFSRKYVTSKIPKTKK